MAEVAAALKQLSGTHAKRARRVTAAERVAAAVAAGTRRVNLRDSLRAFQTLALAREALQRDARLKENSAMQSALSHCNDALSILGGHQNAFAAPRVRVNRKGGKVLRVQFEHLHGDVQTTAKQIAAYNMTAKIASPTVMLMFALGWLGNEAQNRLARKTKPGLSELIRPEVRGIYAKHLSEFQGGSFRVRWNAVQGTRFELTTEKPPKDSFGRVFSQFVSMRTGLPQGVVKQLQEAGLTEQLLKAVEKHLQ